MMFSTNPDGKLGRYADFEKFVSFVEGPSIEALRPHFFL
jgi:hypothetical protein